MEKPPLGLKPRYICENERITEILKAMLRYINSAYPIPEEWIQELSDINKSYSKYCDDKTEKMYNSALTFFGLNKEES